MRRRVSAVVVMAICSLVAWPAVAAQKAQLSGTCKGSPRDGSKKWSAYSRQKALAEQALLYQFAVASFGAPRSCVWDGDGVRFAFRGGAEFLTSSSDEIEYVEHELRGVSLKREEAMSLLRRLGATWFGSEQCDTNWEKPETAKAKNGRSAVHYRGELCNCAGHLELKGDTVVSVGFSSAC